MFAEIHIHSDLPQQLHLPFVLHSVGVCRDQERIHRALGYYCFHVIWVTEGEGFFQINGSEKILSPGEGVFFRPGIPHTYYGITESFKTSWFTYSGAESLLDYYNVQECFYFSLPPFMNSSIEALESFCNGNSNIITRSGAGYALLTEFLNSCFAPSISFEKLVDQYLENNFSKNLSLEDIASALEVNKFSLCHRYAKCKGFTVIEQLKRIRIAKAKRYLVTTGSPVKEIGKLCGFESPSYFGKIFLQETGYTPREYRKLNH